MEFPDVHLHNVQRLKVAQGLETIVEIPRVGYLSLPEYSGELDAPAPGWTRIDSA